MANKIRPASGHARLLGAEDARPRPDARLGNFALRIQQARGEVLQVNQGRFIRRSIASNSRGSSTEWGDSENNRQAKYYQLTKAGESSWPKRPGTGSGSADAVASILAH